MTGHTLKGIKKLQPWSINGKKSECFTQFIEQNILQYLGYTYIHIILYWVTLGRRAPAVTSIVNTVPPKTSMDVFQGNI